MKKLILAIAMMVMTSLSTLAIERWVGGAFSFGTNNVDIDGHSVSTTGFGLKPEVGFQITDKLAVGGELGFEYQDTSEADMTTWAIGPFVRYDFYRLDRVTFFGEAVLRYVNTKIKGLDAFGGFDIQLRPGISVQLSEKLSLIGRITFLDYSHLSNSDFSLSGSGINLTSSLSVGFAYRF